MPFRFTDPGTGEVKTFDTREEAVKAALFAQRLGGPSGPTRETPPGPTPGFEAQHQQAAGEGLPVRSAPFVEENLARVQPLMSALEEKAPEVAAMAAAPATGGAALGVGNLVRGLGGAIKGGGGFSMRVPGTAGAVWTKVPSLMRGLRSLAGVGAEVGTEAALSGAVGGATAAAQGKDVGVGAEQGAGANIFGVPLAAVPTVFRGVAGMLGKIPGLRSGPWRGATPTRGTPSGPTEVENQLVDLNSRLGRAGSGLKSMETGGTEARGLVEQGRAIQQAGLKDAVGTVRRGEQEAEAVMAPGLRDLGAERDILKGDVAELKGVAGSSTQERFRAMNEKIRKFQAETGEKASKEVILREATKAGRLVDEGTDLSVKGGEPLSTYLERHKAKITEVQPRSPQIAKAMKERAEHGAEKLAERDVYQHGQQLWPGRNVSNYEGFHRIVTTEGYNAMGQEYRAAIQGIADTVETLPMKISAPTETGEIITSIERKPAMNAFNALWESGKGRKARVRGESEVSYQEAKDLIIKDLEERAPEMLQVFNEASKTMAQRKALQVLHEMAPKVLGGGRFDVKAAREALLNGKVDREIFNRAGQEGMDYLKTVTGAYPGGGGSSFFPE